MWYVLKTFGSENKIDAIAKGKPNDIVTLIEGHRIKQRIPECHEQTICVKFYKKKYLILQRHTEVLKLCDFVDDKVFTFNKVITDNKNFELYNLKI